MQTKNIKYPFKEGNNYWTIENNNIVLSCWDYISEQLFTIDKKYYLTEQEAKNELIKNEKMKKSKIKLSDINHDVNENFIVCSIVLNDGSYIKEKYIGYNLCDAKKTFLRMINSL